MLKLAFYLAFTLCASFGVFAFGVSTNRDTNAWAQAKVHDVGLDFAQACRASSYCPNRVRHDAIIYTVRTVQWLEHVQPTGASAGL